jgi:hypothetical protein
MTDVLLDYDPNDTGDIPPLPGETRTRIDLGEKTRDLSARRQRRDTTDEATRNLGPYVEFSHPIRRPISDVTAKTVLVDAPLGLSPGDLAPYWDIEPDSTVTFGVVYQAAATIDGELRPAAPGPLPSPLPPPPPPAPQPSDYAGRHRLTWNGRVRRVLTGMGVVGLALVAIWAGLTLAAVAVFL